MDNRITFESESITSSIRKIDAHINNIVDATRQFNKVVQEENESQELGFVKFISTVTQKIEENFSEIPDMLNEIMAAINKYEEKLEEFSSVPTGLNDL